MALVRELVAADIPAIFAVRVSTTENAITIEQLDDLGITPESTEAAIRNNLKGWVAEVDGEVVGFVMGDKDNAEVTVLALRPETEGRGIGRELMRRVTEWLFAEGHDELWLLTGAISSFRAYGFYQAIGWQPTGERVDANEKFILRRS